VSLLLIRHAFAGDPDQWEGDDRLRPLDERGRRQAAALPDVLSELELDRIVSSPYVRCVQTVEPLAQARGVPIELDEQLGADRLDEVPEVLERLRGRNAAEMPERCASVPEVVRAERGHAGRGTRAGDRRPETVSSSRSPTGSG